LWNQIFLQESWQKWALILQKYNFDIIHKVRWVNWDVDGLNQNPSSNEEDTIRAHWHGDVDLEIVPS
jgi:hypothetical protein